MAWFLLPRKLEPTTKHEDGGWPRDAARSSSSTDSIFRVGGQWAESGALLDVKMFGSLAASNGAYRRAATAHAPREIERTFSQPNQG